MWPHSRIFTSLQIARPKCREKSARFRSCKISNTVICIKITFLALFCAHIQYFCVPYPQGSRALRLFVCVCVSRLPLSSHSRVHTVSFLGYCATVGQGRCARQAIRGGFRAVRPRHVPGSLPLTSAGLSVEVQQYIYHDVPPQPETDRRTRRRYLEILESQLSRKMMISRRLMTGLVSNSSCVQVNNRLQENLQKPLQRLSVPALEGGEHRGCRDMR